MIQSINQMKHIFNSFIHFQFIHSFSIHSFIHFLTSCNTFINCAIRCSTEFHIGKNIITVDACVHNIVFSNTATRSFSLTSPSTASNSDTPCLAAASKYGESTIANAKSHNRCKCCACVRVETNDCGAYEPSRVSTENTD